MKAALCAGIVAAFGAVSLAHAQKPEPRPAEQWHVVTAKVERVHGEYGDRLKISDPPDRVYEVGWPEYPVTKLPIVSGNVYTLTILTEPYFNLDFSQALNKVVWSSQQVLIKVVHDGMVLMDANLCEVHGAKMERKELPIRYGEPGSSFMGIPFNMWNEKFPHGFSCAFGGCIVVDGKSPVTKPRFVCAKCVEDAAAWRARLSEQDK
jgi:hypothetical protein